MACLAIGFGRARRELSALDEGRLAQALLEVPGHAALVLEKNEQLRELAAEIAKARDVLFLGRGSLYPIALESALKLKGISYIHAEGYAACEMKHGSIALVYGNVPVIDCVRTGHSPRRPRAICKRQLRAVAASWLLPMQTAPGVCCALPNG
jgi:glucosamine--fructose-6-phosphate aminotransferase (isomerizing)